MDEVMEEGTDGGWREGWRLGWRAKWKLGWINGWGLGWCVGYKKGGREEGMEGGLMGGLDEGESEGWIEGNRQGYTEGLRQGWMETGMEGGIEEGREGEEIEEWMEGWKEGWRLKWKKREDGGENGGTTVWINGWREAYRGGLKWGGKMAEMMDGGFEEVINFWYDVYKLETETEVIRSIKIMIYHPAFESFLSKGNYDLLGDEQKRNLNFIEKFVKSTTFKVISDEDRQGVFDKLVLLARSVIHFVKDIILSSVKQFPNSESNDFRERWNTVVQQFEGIRCQCQLWEYERDRRKQSISKVIDVVRDPLIDLNILPKLLRDIPDSIPDLEDKEIILIKAFPALGELKESSKMFSFLLDVTDQLDMAITMICNLCKESSPAVVLIGSLLSFKRSDSDAWLRVHTDLKKMIEFCNLRDSLSQLRTIFTYCFQDLPEFLQACFQYLACYPRGSEIPATWLTKIWIAEGFVKPEKEETLEETANNYLEQFVQRSLIWVSMRSYSGTIKYFRVPSLIHEYVIENSVLAKFLYVNPAKERMESLMHRVVIHRDDNNQYPEVKFKIVRSFLAFDLDKDVLGRATCTYLRVLELRNSAISLTTVSKFYHLQYLSLRGGNIIYSASPSNIRHMKDLKTLDLRDTYVIPPESIWSISSLRHVHVNPRLQIPGPPQKANLPNLQTLKTIVVPKSWLANFPQTMINLRKLALSNMDNPAYKSNPYWKSISNLLSHVVNLLSMTIIGDIVPAEFVDTKAFPNLETVKSIKLEGRWNYFKLTIDNNKFPSNLSKLILTKSGLREDPMPRLERLQGLKYLSLKDGTWGRK